MTIVYFILAALALGVLVFIHELGHYFAAKSVGMVVEIFSIGFGRPILKWRWQGVNWQLGWLPFGGYVKVKGMEISKQEQGLYKEPYEIPGGFFSKSPLKRIWMAIAGPLANLFLGFFLFTLIYVGNGREKPFSEFTHIIGWVDPASELYTLGVRPGDQIDSYDHRAYTTSKDHLYAAMLGGKHVEVDGEKIDYYKQSRTPFAYSIETYPSPFSLKGIRTVGILAGAQYLIYDKYPDGKENPILEGSPMEGSGLKYGDRLVWANGELLFSLPHLNYILNQNKALLTVERNGKRFLTRQPRVRMQDLILSPVYRNEIIDWQYEGKIKGRWQDLYVLPYDITSDNVIEAPVDFLDVESQQEAFPSHPFSLTLEEPLHGGDRIIAVDGIPVVRSVDLLRQLQSRHVLLIVEEGVALNGTVSWKEVDKKFESSFDPTAITFLSGQIGINGQNRQGSYRLLDPIEPKRLSQFSMTIAQHEKYERDYEENKKKIEEIKDHKKRAETLKLFEQGQNKLLLGVMLQDREVKFNPSPFSLVGSVFTETWRTLKALVMGYLNPKWLAGPIGIVQVIHHGWTVGLNEALFWIGAISLNLAFFNLLPIPVLDGGYICLSLWEMLTRRRLKSKTLERIVIPFVVLIFLLFIFLTFQDISRFF